MKTISISDARNHLPSVIEEVLRTHEHVVVVRYGTPTVAIMPFQDMRLAEDRYPLRGHPITLAEDFDEPMPNLWEALAGAEKHNAYGTQTAERALAGKSGKRRKKG